MRAMVLAAGLGTRLRPLTNDRPKALVEVNGRTLLEMTLTRLRAFGIGDVIVNVHHFAGMVVEYLRANDNFGMHIEVSREDQLLDTGGGLKKAGYFFLGDSREEPFVLHNVDIASTIDLGRMVRLHRDRGALATLAVQQRKSSRQLLFNGDAELCGRSIAEADEIVRNSEERHPLAFSGVHVISPRLLTRMKEDGVFSIIDTYLRLASEGDRIVAFRADEYYWRDLGRFEDLKQASEDMKLLPIGKSEKG